MVCGVDEMSEAGGKKKKKARQVRSDLRQHGIRRSPRERGLGAVFTDEAFEGVEANMREGFRRTMLRIRADGSLTQRDAAAMCGISFVLWRFLENALDGKGMMFSTVLRLSLGHGLKPSEFLRRVEQGILDAAKERKAREDEAAREAAESSSAASAPQGGGAEPVRDTMAHVADGARRCIGCGGTMVALWYEKPGADGTMFAAPTGMWKCLTCERMYAAETPAPAVPKPDELRWEFEGQAVPPALAEIERAYDEVTRAEHPPTLAVNAATGEVVTGPAPSTFAPEPDEEF